MLEQRKPVYFRFLAPCALYLALILLMQWYIDTFQIPKWMVASPSDIITAFERYFVGDIFPNFLITLGEILIGYCIAVPFGLLVAVGLTQYRTFNKAFSPYTIAIISTPLVVLVPLLTIWMGIGIQVKVIAVTLQSFTIVMMNCSTGFNNIDPLKLELMKAVGATRWQRLKYVIFPSSLPNIFNGMRMSAISASTAALATEFYSSTDGLGARIMYASAYLKTDMMFACIVMVAVTGVALYMIPGAIEKMVVRWKI